MTLRRLSLLVLGLVVAGAMVVAWAIPFPYAALVHQAAHRERVDPFLVAAVIRVESSFNAAAQSNRGAQGLMQVMPDTADWVSQQSGLHGRLTDPEVNISVGTWYLAYLLRRYHHHWRLALAAYNSGPQVVDGWLRQGEITESADPDSIPYPETRAFVTRVLMFYHWYRVVYGLWPGG